MNPRLAAIISAAKKQGVPKQSIENAIARGQGVSLTGAALENVTIEAMFPPVAVIVECQTDNRLRTLADMRLLVKECGGTMTPTSHIFDRKGRIVFERSDTVREEDIFDETIEAGAIDVWTKEDGSIVVLAKANETVAVADALSKSTGLKVQSSEIIWDPKKDMVVSKASNDTLDSFFSMHGYIDFFMKW